MTENGELGAGAEEWMQDSIYWRGQLNRQSEQMRILETERDTAVAAVLSAQDYIRDILGYPCVPDFIAGMNADRANEGEPR